MLKSEREYSEAHAAVRDLERELEGIAASKNARPVSQGRLGAMRARIAQLRDEAFHFERIKAGDLSGFDDVADFGRLLVAGRIARGLSQRDLATRLDVHESQVSRDERNEYEGITLARWKAICAVLDINVESVARLASAVARHETDEARGAGRRAASESASKIPSVLAPRVIPASLANPPTLFDAARLHDAVWVEAPAYKGWRRLAAPMISSDVAGPTGPTGVSVYLPAAA